MLLKCASVTMKQPSNLNNFIIKMLADKPLKKVTSQGNLTKALTLFLTTF